MMALMEDMRLFLRQMCGAVGMSGTAANVVPVVLLGIALNVAALGLVASVRTARQPACQRTTLQAAAQTEWKVVRTVVSTVKAIGQAQRRLCAASDWVESL
jgi:hypothetical protein